MTYQKVCVKSVSEYIRMNHYLGFSNDLGEIKRMDIFGLNLITSLSVIWNKLMYLKHVCKAHINHSNILNIIPYTNV